MYGTKFCENERRYLVTDFSVKSNFEKPKNSNTKPKSTFESEKQTTTSKTEKDKKISNSSTLRVSKPLKPSIQDLTQEQIDKARMVKASRLAFEDSFEAAQSYLDKEGIPYDIDTSLSSKESLVLVGDDGVKIAYRGTKITNVNDVSADGMIAAGVEEYHPQFRDAEEQIKLVTEKYGVPNELLGYSLGGNKAMTMGNKLNIDTTTFNPFLGKNLVASTSGASHTILRTTEDFASLGIGLAKGKEGWNVSSILPHKDKINPIEAHELENFTETSTRRPGNTETLIRTVQRAGMKAGEMDLIGSMHVGIEEGMTFTEWLHKFNSATGQDTSPDGSELAGSRMHRNSKWVKYWEEAHDSTNNDTPAFTESEEAYFDRLGDVDSTYDPAIRPKERAKFHDMSPSEKEDAIQKSHENLESIAEAVDLHTEPYKASANILKRAIHPTNLATGLAGGVAANALMDDVIDRDHRIEEHARTGLEGGLAGAATEMGAAYLAGNALTGGSLGVASAAGGVSYIAASESGKLVTKGLESAGVDKTASEGVGAATGGAVGGFAAAGSAIGGGALMGAELGEFGGPVGLAVGTGVGSVVGLAGWAIGKLFG